MPTDKTKKILQINHLGVSENGIYWQASTFIGEVMINYWTWQSYFRSRSCGWAISWSRNPYEGHNILEHSSESAMIVSWWLLLSPTCLLLHLSIKKTYLSIDLSTSSHLISSYLISSHLILSYLSIIYIYWGYSTWWKFPNTNSMFAFRKFHNVLSPHSLFTLASSLHTHRFTMTSPVFATSMRRGRLKESVLP